MGTDFSTLDRVKDLEKRTDDRREQIILGQYEILQSLYLDINVLHITRKIKNCIDWLASNSNKTNHINYTISTPRPPDFHYICKSKDFDMKKHVNEMEAKLMWELKQDKEIMSMMNNGLKISPGKDGSYCEVRFEKKQLEGELN